VGLKTSVSRKLKNRSLAAPVKFRLNFIVRIFIIFDDDPMDHYLFSFLTSHAEQNEKQIVRRYTQNAHFLEITFGQISRREVIAETISHVT
jgi:DNA topoisomerase VI subunit A